MQVPWAHWSTRRKRHLDRTRNCTRLHNVVWLTSWHAGAGVGLLNKAKGNTSPYSITKRRVPELIPILCKSACRVTVLGKLFTPIVPLFTKQQNW